MTSCNTFSEETLTALRLDTPGVEQRMHFDSAGCSIMARSVLDVQIRHLEEEAIVGGYVAQEQHADRLEGFYDSLATLLGGDARNFAFAGSAVDAWTKAFYSLNLQSGDNIVTAYNEYCSNFVAFIHMKKTRGIEIRVAPAGEDGTLDLEALEGLIDSNTKVISVSHVPSSSGQVNDVHAVGVIARRHDVPFLLDSCQSIGQLPVNIKDIGCDMLIGTGRKFLRGPRGTGFLYINDTMLKKINPVVLTNQSAVWTADFDYELRTDARIFEAWERSVAGQLCLGAAIDYLLDIGPDAAFTAIASNASYLRKNIASIPNVTSTCPADASGAIITFNKKDKDPTEVKAVLHARNIGVQTASVVHTRLDLDARGIQSAVRVSPHYYHSKDDMDDLLTAIEDI